MKNKSRSSFKAQSTEARRLFEQEQFYTAGKIYCQRFSLQEKVRWAERIVATIYQGSPRIEVVEQALALAQQADRWSEGYQLFQSLRQQGLRLLKDLEAKPVVRMLSLTEKLAKLIYNATSPPGPFDDDVAEQLANQVGCEAPSLLGSRNHAIEILFPLPS
jgi:hypothetical protein